MIGFASLPAVSYARGQMMIPFHKMHGLGNDFVIIDARETPVSMTETCVRALADRRTGIGCDQLIVIEPSQCADVRMLIYNSDGGEVEACGNVTRCVALLINQPVTIETVAGILRAHPGKASATVTLGQPAFGWEEIPLAIAMDTSDMPVSWEELGRPVAVNVGNPHIIFFVDDCDIIDLATIGQVIEHDSLFPERINVNVATITGRNSLSLRVWERGVGLTQACGTGACATAVAAIRAGRVKSPVRVTLPGGVLTIEWSPGMEIIMTGPAKHVFTGSLDLDNFA